MQYRSINNQSFLKMCWKNNSRRLIIFAFCLSTCSLSVLNMGSKHGSSKVIKFEYFCTIYCLMGWNLTRAKRWNVLAFDMQSICAEYMIKIWFTCSQIMKIIYWCPSWSLSFFNIVSKFGLWLLMKFAFFLATYGLSMLNTCSKRDSRQVM